MHIIEGKVKPQSLGLVQDNGFIHEWVSPISCFYIVSCFFFFDNTETQDAELCACRRDLSVLGADVPLQDQFNAGPRKDSGHGHCDSVLGRQDQRRGR